MTKREFLSELRMALEGNIPVQDIEDNIRYYDNYFAESGRPGREVCEELGDPRLIARTLIDSFTAAKGPMADFYKEQARDDYSRESRNEGSYESDGIGGFGDKWYDKLFRYVLLISIAIIVGAVLIFVLKVTVTVVIPVVVIVLIIKFLLDLFRRY